MSPTTDTRSQHSVAIDAEEPAVVAGPSEGICGVAVVGRAGFEPATSEVMSPSRQSSAVAAGHAGGR